MPEARQSLVETAFAGSNPYGKKLAEALQPVGDLQWSKALAAYRRHLEMTSFVDRVLKRVSSMEGDQVDAIFDLLGRLREAERENLELRAAQAGQAAPTDVTSQHHLSNSHLLSEKDAVLHRIALSNCKKHGRRLLQKWHPDREGGDAEVFDMCRMAIDSGDVELVQILLYRFGDNNAVKDFDPERIAETIAVRTTRYTGTRLFSVFSLYINQPFELFAVRLIELLSARLNHLKSMNIPGALGGETQPGESDEEPDSAE